MCIRDRLIYYSMSFWVCQALFSRFFWTALVQPLETSLTGSPFGFLLDRSGVPLSDSSIIIPRQLPFVNTFFHLFWLFSKNWIFLKNSKRAAKLLCFHRSFAYWWLWLLNCVWVGIFNLVRFKAAGGQIGPILHVPPVVGILHADNQVIIK